MTLTFDLTDEMLERVAVRAAELVAERATDATPEAVDGWLRGAGKIAEYIDAPESRVYALHSAGRIWPVQKDGSALVAKRSDLDRWMREGGGVRT